MNINTKVSDVLILIGRNVKKYRLIKGFTQQEVAYKCGNMDRATISNIERFACEGLYISTLVKISETLEINVKQLFEP